MATGSSVMGLYLAPINIWVEDELTRQTLLLLWADTTINVMTAGSQGAVKNNVNGAEPTVRSSVFGVVDRDFERDNYAQWRDPTQRIFRLPAHEVENLLLDFRALAKVSGKETAEAIEQVARRRAEELLWWTACKAVLRQVADTRPEFPMDPPQPTANPPAGVHDEESAIAHLRDPDYWNGLLSHQGDWTPDRFRTELRAKASALQQDLESDAWRLTFPGKELLRHLRSQVNGLKSSGGNQSKTERDLDLGKRLGAELSVEPPAILAELKAILRSRVGLT